MSSGSDASILGYGNINSNGNVDGHFINKTAGNYAGGFTSQVIPYSSLFSAKNNVDAVAGYIPSSSSFFRGGRKRREGKRKRFTTHKKKNHMFFYNMRKTGKTRKFRDSKKKGLFSKLRNTFKKGFKGFKGLRKIKVPSFGRKYKGKKTKRRGFFRGGTQAYTPSYALGGNLPPNLSALANPSPYTAYGPGSCYNNYNHYTGATS
jgi:hypothetical protein